MTLRNRWKFLPVMSMQLLVKRRVGKAGLSGHPPAPERAAGQPRLSWINSEHRQGINDEDTDNRAGERARRVRWVAT
jgi:hypothetical protein